MKSSEIIKISISLVLSVFAIIGAIIVFDHFFDKQIDEKINSPEYIEKISLTVRPFLLFNKDNQIIYDHGALQYIDSLKIESAKNLKLPVSELEADFLVTIFFN